MTTDMAPSGTNSAAFVPAGMIPTGVLPMGMVPTGMIRAMPAGMMPAGAMQPNMMSAPVSPCQVPDSSQQFVWSTANRWSVWPRMMPANSMPSNSISQDSKIHKNSCDPSVQDFITNAASTPPSDEQVALSAKEGPRIRRKQRKSAAEVVAREIWMPEPGVTAKVPGSPGSPGLSACSTDMDDFDCAHSTSSHSSTPLDRALSSQPD